MEKNNKINKDTHDKYTEAYIDILTTYREQISLSVTQKNTLKEEFFKTIKRIIYLLSWFFVIILMLSLIIFGIMIFKNYNSVSIITGAITTVVSSFITMIIAIFKLPEIIAEYLFNKQEDQLMNEVIRNIQIYEIDAVRSGFEKRKLERLKQLNSKVSYSFAPDDDLGNSFYDTPSQDINNQFNEKDG